MFSRAKAEYGGAFHRDSQGESNQDGDGGQGEGGGKGEGDNNDSDGDKPGVMPTPVDAMSLRRKITSGRLV